MFKLLFIIVIWECGYNSAVYINVNNLKAELIVAAQGVEKDDMQIGTDMNKFTYGKKSETYKLVVPNFRNVSNNFLQTAKRLENLINVLQLIAWSSSSGSDVYIPNSLGSQAINLLTSIANTFTNITKMGLIGLLSNGTKSPGPNPIEITQNHWQHIASVKLNMAQNFLNGQKDLLSLANVIEQIISSMGSSSFPTPTEVRTKNLFKETTQTLQQLANGYGEVGTAIQHVVQNYTTTFGNPVNNKYHTPGTHRILHVFNKGAARLGNKFLKMAEALNMYITQLKEI